MEIDKTKITYILKVGLGGVDVVDLATAKYIKTLGYNIPSYWYWRDGTIPFVKNGLFRIKYKSRRMNHNRYDEWIYSAPTRDEVMKWIKKNQKNNDKNKF